MRPDFQKQLFSFILILSSLFISGCKIIDINKDLQVSDIPESIELLKIPQGYFSSGKGNTKIFISYDYYMMKYPVTNKQYVEYLRDSMENGSIIVNSDSIIGYYHGDKNWAEGYYLYLDLDDPDCRILFFPPDIFAIYNVYLGPNNSGNETYENHPVTEVSWFGAHAFAKHYGLSLPTTNEWEKAARANLGYLYSWGNDLDSSRANFFNSGDMFDNNTTPAGYYNGSNNTIDSPSPYGMYDMTGNVWEWTDDWKGESPGKIIKGGSWNSRSLINETYSELFTWFERPVVGSVPTNSTYDVGFRCVLRNNISY